VLFASKYSAKKYNSGHPPSWICCDVIILDPGAAFYAVKTVLNFHDDWFRIFLNTLIFMFPHFGFKLPIQAKFLRFTDE